MNGSARSWLLLALGVPILLLVVLPLLVLLVQAISSASILLSSSWLALGIDALWLSLWTTTLALGVTVLSGTAIAMWLCEIDDEINDAHGGFLEDNKSKNALYVEKSIQVRSIKNGLERLLLLPVVLPPAVAGIALLSTFGRNGPVGIALEQWQIHVVFTPVAVVIAQIFVATPIYIQNALAAFRSIPRVWWQAAAVHGATPMQLWWQILLPAVFPSLLAGAALAWARALGEFGATLLFAGNLSGATQTLPLAVYAALESDTRIAQGLAVFLLLMALTVFFVTRRWQRRP